MNVKVTVTTVGDLTPNEYKRCLKLTFDGTEGRYGTLQGDLENLRMFPRPNRVYLAKNEKGTIVGWALGQPDRYKGRGTSIFIMMYVPPYYRRKGIGTKILAKVRQGRKAPIGVAMHDGRSTGFYTKQKNAINVWY